MIEVDGWMGSLFFSRAGERLITTQTHLLFAINDKKNDVTGLYFQVLNLDDFSWANISIQFYGRRGHQQNRRGHT